MKTYTQMKSIQDFNKKALLSALLFSGLVMGSTGVYAATATGDMTTTAAITSSCSVSASTLDFGSIAALDTTADVTGDTAGSLSVACTTGTTTPKIYSDTARTMLESGAGTATLTFNLSQTTGAASDNLPATALASEAMTGYTANGSAIIVPIYGRIPTASFTGKPVGSYTATIVISVDYS
jgi:hypothetical protein